MLFFLVLSFSAVKGQTILFSENFGTTAGSALPPGWSQTGATQQWLLNTSNASTPPYSGGANLLAQNQGANGVTHTVTYSNNLSTIGYSNLKVIWAARATTTFAQTINFSWSSDGTNWNNVTYTQVPNNATWSNVNNNVKILLPTAAGNIPNLRFRWSYSANNSGNYRIDDFSLEGTTNCPVQVLSFTPDSGPAGTEVTINGSNFTGATGVFFQSTPASGFSVINDNTIKAIVPAGASSGNVSVFNSCSGVSTSTFEIINTSCALNGTNLILSELCSPDLHDGTERYIEIYNPTNNTIDLSGWTVRAISNGGITASCLQWTLSGTISPGQALTCGHSNPAYGGPHNFPDPAWWASYPTNTNPNECYFNWNGQQRDGASLYYGTTRIDGIFRADLANDWYNEKSLIRNPDVCSPNNNSPYTQWTVTGIVPHAGDLPSTPRSHSTNCTVSQPSITQHPQSQTFCNNQTVNLTVSASGGLTPYNYIWKVFTGSGTWQTITNGTNYSGANTATLTIINAPSGFDGYQYYCEIWNQDNSCYQATNTAIIHVTSSILPTISINPDANPICAGTTVIFSSAITNGGTSPTYQWKKNGNNVGTNSQTYVDNSLLNNDVISCVLVSSEACASPASVTSNEVTMIVSFTLTPTISISADNNPICTGTSVVFSATITNGGTTPVFQWKKNNLNVGTNSSTYIDNTLVNNDIITCVLTSNELCSSPTVIASNTITMTVTSTLAPTISVIPDNNPICSGTMVLFSAIINNGGTSPIFQWKKNGLNVGSNNPTYSDNTLVNNDVISCVLTSNASCAVPSVATSNLVTMIVTSTLTPSILITSDKNPICAGATVLFSSTILNGGTSPVYQWKKNGSNVGINSSTYIDNTLANNDLIQCLLTSNSGCASPSTVNSNQIIITVNAPPGAPAILSQNVIGTNQEVCTGYQYAYSINPINPTSTYIWTLTGGGQIQPPGTGSTININWGNTPGTYLLTVVETTIDGCNGVPGILNVTVNTPSTASVTILPDYNSVCSGQPVTYTATPENGGTSPEYTWYVNNIPEPSSNTPVFNYTSNDPYTIYVALNSSSPCAIPNPVYSDTITMSVLPVVSPSVSITADINTVCEGTPITFTAEILNGGNAPVYQWKKNGDDAGTNDSTFTGIFNNNDLISCVITSNALCASPPTVTSNEVIVVIKPAPSVTGTTQSNPTTCGGTDGTISLEGLIPGNSYLVNFSFNGTPVPTKYINTNSSGILTITGLRAGNYSGIIVTFNGCSSLPVIANLNDPGSTSAPTVNNNFYSICQGDSVEISVTGCGGTVKWSNGANNSATYVSPNVTFSYTATCEVNGCISAPSDPIEVFVNVKPLISIQTITNPSTWCVDDGVITLTGLLPGEVYTIRFNDGSIADSIIGSSSPTGLFEITGCAPTTYFNISAEHNDCRSENIVAIVGDPVSPTVPMITANEDTICPGQTVVLTATGCSGIVTWDDGTQGTTLTISPAATNSFKATCTESACTSAYSIPVTVTVESADIAAIEGDKNYCVDGQILLNAVGDAITYQWILPDGTSEYIQNFEKGNISLNDSGFYVLSTMDLLGCSDRDSIEISVNLAPVISIAPADTLCAGIQYMLSPGEGYPSYLWHDGSTLSSFPAFDEGGYWVQVTDTNGCTVTSSVWLTYCPQDVYIPNAFSPDRNGINEFFVPVTGGNVLLDYYMIIYNRWGQKVFESYDYHTGWNGTLNGNDSPSGLYTYLIMYKISDPKNQVAGELQKIRGTVTLLR